MLIFLVVFKLMVNMVIALPTMLATNKITNYILTSNMATGTKNVRWETSPMNIMDSNGRAVPAKSTKTKNDDGTTSFGCPDAYSNAIHPHGETYQRANGKFNYRCNNGLEEVVGIRDDGLQICQISEYLACIGSERTNKAVIPVGQTLEVDGYWHKCQSFPNNTVVYTQASSCHYAGKDYHVGDVINVGHLRLQCQINGYKVVGCLYLDENNKTVQLSAGEKKKDEKSVHNCEQKKDTLEYSSTVSGCTKNGKNYKEGETFNANHLRYKCVNGIVDIVGCYVNDKNELSVGQNLVKNNFAHRCYRLGAKVEYTEFPCDSTGNPSCKLDSISQIPDDVHTFSHEFKTPGVGSFDIVQEVGSNGQVANPSPMKIEISKVIVTHQ